MDPVGRCGCFQRGQRLCAVGASHKFDGHRLRLEIGLDMDPEMLALLVRELDSGRYQRWVDDYRDFVRTDGVGVLPVGPVQPHRVRDVMPSRIWSAYEGVRAYEPVLRWVSAEQARELVAKGGSWLDVRLPSEFQNLAVEGAVNVPLYFIRLKLNMLQKGKPYIVYCDTGRRSSAAAFILVEKGYDAYVLKGGLSAPPALRQTSANPRGGEPRELCRTPFDAHARMV